MGGLLVDNEIFPKTPDCGMPKSQKSQRLDISDPLWSRASRRRAEHFLGVDGATQGGAVQAGRPRLGCAVVAVRRERPGRLAAPSPRAMPHRITNPALVRARRGQGPTETLP